MSDSIICDRSFEFAARVLALCAKLWDRGPAARRIASELIRCGTSIGANAEEAQDGQTKPDYIAKMSVSRKESRETLYWLRLALHLETPKRAMRLRWLQPSALSPTASALSPSP